MATTTTTTSTSTTVDNLNVLDTSKTNDAVAEVVTLQEVANALFPTTNAQQTLTIDQSFWAGSLRLTFTDGAHWYTIWGSTSSVGAQSINFAQTSNALGDYNTTLT